MFESRTQGGHCDGRGKACAGVRTDHSMSTTKPSMHPISRFKSSSRQSGRDSDAWFERNASKASGRYPVKRRHSGIGSEPGLDAREQKPGFSRKCTIHVTDYSSEHVSLNTLNNAEFVESMKLPQLNPQDERPTLEQSPRLRWINIGGISWDVLSALALRYGSRLSRGLSGESLHG